MRNQQEDGPGTPLRSSKDKISIVKLTREEDNELLLYYLPWYFYLLSLIMYSRGTREMKFVIIWEKLINDVEVVWLVLIILETYWVTIVLSFILMI